MIRRVMVGLGDRELSKVATMRAIDVARRFDAEVTAITVVDLARLEDVGPVPLGAGHAAHDLRKHRLHLTRQIVQDTIAHFEQSCSAANVRHRVLYEEGEPFSAIVAHARYHDLMIFGLSHLFEHGVIEEPPDELIHLIDQGVRPILAVNNSVEPIRKALISYSGSMESAKTMRLFIRMKLWEDVTVRIITFGDPQDVEVVRRITEAVEYIRLHGYEPEHEVVNDSAVSGILPYANQWGADILVIGNSAKSLIRRKIFGATTLTCIRNATQSLFLSQ